MLVSWVAACTDVMSTSATSKLKLQRTLYNDTKTTSPDLRRLRSAATQCPVLVPPLSTFMLGRRVSSLTPISSSGRAAESV